MSWKNLAGWLKGGIIGGVVGIIPILLLFLRRYTDIFSLGEKILIIYSIPFYFLLKPLKPSVFVVNLQLEAKPNIILDFFGLIMAFIILLIIGALIGLIISKLKSKNAQK
jgi:hypothetical protein